MLATAEPPKTHKGCWRWSQMGRCCSRGCRPIWQWLGWRIGVSQSLQTMVEPVRRQWPAMKIFADLSEMPTSFKEIPMYFLQICIWRGMVFNLEINIGRFGVFLDGFLQKNLISLIFSWSFGFVTRELIFNVILIERA